MSVRQPDGGLVLYEKQVDRSPKIKVLCGTKKKIFWEVSHVVLCPYNGRQWVSVSFGYHIVLNIFVFSRRKSSLGECSFKDLNLVFIFLNKTVFYFEPPPQMSLSLQASQTHTGSNISRVCQSSYSKCSNNWECRFLPCRDFTSRRTGLDTHYFSTWRRNKFLQGPWANFNVFVHWCLRFLLFCQATDPCASKRDYTPLYTKYIC